MSNSTIIIQDNSACVATDDSIYTPAWLPQGGFIAVILGIIVMFWGITFICEEYGVPSLRKFCERNNFSDDFTGSIFIGTGLSLPVFFISLVGLFASNSAIGVGAVVGGNVFNHLVTIPCSIYVSPNRTMILDPVTFTREMLCYFLTCLLLLWATQNGKLGRGLQRVYDEEQWQSCLTITWSASLILIMAYVFYCLLTAFYNSIVDRLTYYLFKSYLLIHSSGAAGGDQHLHHHFPAIGGEGPEEEQERRRRKRKSSSPHSPQPYRLSEILMIRRSPDSDNNSYRSEEDDSRYPDNDDDNEEGRGEGEEDEEERGYNSINHNANSSHNNNNSNSNLARLEDVEISSRSSSSSSSKPHIPREIRERQKLERLERSLQKQQLQHHNHHNNNNSFDLMGNTSYDRVQNDEDRLESFDYHHIYSSPPSSSSKRHGSDEDLIVQPVNNMFAYPDSLLERVFYWLVFPQKLLIYLTVPDVRQSRHEHRAMLAFLLTLAWLGIQSYLLTVSLTLLGNWWNVNGAVMGLTVAAWAGNYPAHWSSLVVARKGDGDIAACNVYGSNVFNNCIGLGLPWILYSIVYGRDYTALQDQGVALSLILLMGVIVIHYLMAAYCGFVHTTWMMPVMFAMYLGVLVYLCYFLIAIG